MKRLIAFLGVFALLVSMFGNVAFSEPAPHQVYVSLDRDIIPYGEGFHIETISGKIFSAETKAVYQVNADLMIIKDNNNNGIADEGDTPIKMVTASNGVFSVDILTGTDETGIGNYAVIGLSDTSSSNPYNFAIDAYDSFTIMYEMELITPDVLEWSFPVSGQIQVSGEFINEDAKATDVVTIEYLEDDSIPPIVAQVVTPSYFGFLFTGEDLQESGKIGIFVNGILAHKGEVLPNGMDVTLTPEKAVRMLGSTQFTADFNFASSYINKENSSMIAKHRVHYYLYDPSGAMIAGPVKLVNPFSIKFNDVEKQIKYFNIDFDENSPTGEYTIVFELRKNNIDNIIQKKTFTFDVVNPKKHNLVQWGLSKPKVGDITFGLPYDECFGSADQVINVKKYTRVGEVHKVETCQYVEIIVEGCGIEKTFSSFDENGLKWEAEGSTYNGVCKVSPSVTGDMTVKINVYSSETDTTPDYSITKQLQVIGWNIEMSTREVVVNSTEDITFIITDENGNPINNAIIEADNTKIVDGTSQSIIGGTYTYSGDSAELFKSVGTIPIKFYTSTKYSADGSPEVSISSGIQVIGDAVYTVESDKDTLLNGIEETVLISTLNADGDIVYPNFYRIDVDSKGVEGSPVEISAANLGSFVDNDGLEGNEARKVKILPTASQSAVIIRTTTDDGKKMGEVRIEVTKPVVELTGVNTLTENFTGLIKANLLDPRDNEILNYDFKVVDASDYFVWDGAEELTYDYDEEVFTKKVLIKAVDWTQAAKDEKDVYLSLVMEGDDDIEVTVQTIPVAKPMLTADPEKVIINTPAYITLCYQDAEGNPIAEQSVYLLDEVVGETNEEGKVVYAASATSSLSLTFEATTEVAEAMTKAKVKAAPDIEMPKATIVLNEAQDMATITITDNVRISMSYVNGELVDMKFPRATATHIVKNLAVGENIFSVQSMDINNNVLDTVLTVTVDNKKQLEVQIGVATKYGTPEMVEGVTMVPLRLAQELGASVDWDEATKTATYTLGNRVIVVTLGKVMALVDGVETEMLVAPYLNSDNRSMVPLRMIAQELGFEVIWTSNNDPVIIH